MVCSTCAGADHPVLQKKNFGCILIDEAGQTTELAVLVAWLGWFVFKFSSSFHTSPTSFVS